MRCFLIGIVAVLSMTLLVLLLSSFVPVIVGVPLVVVLLLFALVLKLWGTVAVFQALGERVALASLRRSPLQRRDPMTAILLGLLLLTALKLVPWAGLVAWTAATFLGAGAAFATKLGRREPWLEGG